MLHWCWYLKVVLCAFLNSFLLSLRMSMTVHFLLDLLFLIREELLNVPQSRLLVIPLHRLLQQVHFIANVVADLNQLVLHLHFLSTSVLEDHLARFVGTLGFLAPLFMFLNLLEKNQVVARVAPNLHDCYELLDNMGATADPEETRALERTVFAPARNALSAEELPTVLALHWVL